MAGFTKKQLENLKLEPENLASIKDAVQETFYNDEDFSSFVNIMKVKNDDPIALIGEMEMVGKKGGGCDPTYEEKGIANSQKRWELGQWEIPIKICYEALKGSIAEYSLKTGTEIGDLTSTDFMTIYTDALQRAMQQMIWRFCWFGDKAAALSGGGGGKLTAGSDVSMFNVCDGLFKRIFTQCTSNASQLTAIAANAQTTYAKQKEAILAEGVATGILESLLMDADSRITSNSNAVVLATKGFTDALHHDIKVKYHINLPWTTIFEGFDVTEFDGVKIARVAIWDRIIKAYENTGTALNKPYRLVYADPRNLMVGSNADGLLSELDIWFEKKERMNYWYATGKLDTQLLEEDLVQAAY